MKIEKALTPRQQEIFQYIQRTIADAGAPPTRAEIAETFHFASPNAAEEHLKALQRKGVLQLKPGTSRGIRILQPPVLASTGNNQGSSGSASQPGTQSLQQGMHSATKPFDPLALGVDSLHLPLCLPLVGRVAAGSPILAQEHVQQNYYVQDGLFSHRPDYLLKVHGESMRDVGIMEGDLLAVQSISHVQDVRDGQIVVARIDDDVTVKTLRRNRNNDIELHPANPSYEIRVVLPEENFAIEGVAVGLIRNNFFY